MTFAKSPVPINPSSGSKNTKIVDFRDFFFKKWLFKPPKNGPDTNFFCRNELGTPQNAENKRNGHSLLRFSNIFFAEKKNAAKKKTRNSAFFYSPEYM